MSKNYQNFIGGKSVPANSGKTYENRSPADTSDVVGIFPYSDASDVKAAVAAAKKAYDPWRKVPAPKRGEIMRRAGEIMVARKEAIARIMTREMGKVLKETRGDVQEGIDTAFYAFGESRRMHGQTVPSELPNKICMVYHQPIGVWGIISPWNFPMAIPTWKIFPALTCGNTVVFKPATDTPATAGEFVAILAEAGVPDGVVNIVYGPGGAVGEAIINDPDIRGVSFTGSSLSRQAHRRGLRQDPEALLAGAGRQERPDRDGRRGPEPGA